MCTIVPPYIGLQNVTIIIIIAKVFHVADIYSVRIGSSLNCALMYENIFCDNTLKGVLTSKYLFVINFVIIR